MRFAISASALAAACIAVPAGATKIIQLDREGVMAGLLTFDASLGTLNSVSLKVDVRKSNFTQLYSTSAAPGDYATSWNTNEVWLLDEATTVYTPTSGSTPTTTGGVAEPATWAMMLIGFGGMIFAARRGRTSTTRVRYA